MEVYILDLIVALHDHNNSQIDWFDFSITKYLAITDPCLTLIARNWIFMMPKDTQGWA